MCGVRTTFLEAARGWLLLKGSGVITSSPAPPSFPACKQHCNEDAIEIGVKVQDDGHLEDLNQSFLVYEPTPGSVDDTGGRFHIAQQASRHNALGCWIQAGTP